MRKSVLSNRIDPGSEREIRRSLDGGAFTPPWLVKRLLSHKIARRHLRNKNSVIIHPLAGDNQLFITLISERLRIHKNIGALETLYGIEPNEGKLDVLRESIIKFFEERRISDYEWFIKDHLIAGDFADCEGLPQTIDFIIGNPSLLPGRKYQIFCLNSLETPADIMFITPTSWLHNLTQAKFATLVSPHLQQPIEKLPWDSFSVKGRSCIVWLRKGFSRSPRLDYQQDSVWLAANQTWGRTLQDYVKGDGNFEAYIGWKSNPEKGSGKINAFQSLDFNRNSPALPTHYTTVKFKTAIERKNFARFMATKLAAYLQTMTDSDNVSMSLPIPPLNRTRYDDSSLMESLDLTSIEKDTVEIFDLYISGKAAEFFSSQNISVRSDAIVGALRKGCPECGSSSFHRKGCSRSTEREKLMRDS